jgi:hypothetical protein
VSNVVSIWRAIDADEAVPELVLYEQPGCLMVWRKGLSPHFQSLANEQAQFLKLLRSGMSINAVCASLVEADQLPAAETLGLWMREWLTEGLLRAD